MEPHDQKTVTVPLEALLRLVEFALLFEPQDEPTGLPPWLDEFQIPANLQASVLNELVKRGVKRTDAQRVMNEKWLRARARACRAAAALARQLGMNDDNAV